MPKYFISLLFLLCSVFAEAHPILDGLETSYQSKKYSDLSDYIDGLLEQSTKKNIFSFKSIIDREITSGYHEFKIEISQSVADEEATGVYNVDYYFVSIIRLKNTIIHYSIEEKIYEQDSTGKWKKKYQLVKADIDSIGYHNLENTYFDIYNSALNFDELFTDSILYGSRCGIGGQNPEYREKLNLIIRNKDKKELKKWLVNATAELQLYAIDGILTLSKKGVRFKNDTYELIGIIIKKEGYVNTCSGCIRMKRTIKDEVSLLFEKHGLSEKNSIRKAIFNQGPE